MSEESGGLVLSGVALRAAVRAAEAPVLGEVAKRNLVSELKLDELFALDLREWDPEPASLPHHAPAAALPDGRDDG